MECGHVEARFYPLGMVRSETALVIQRQNKALANQIALTQLAISSLLSKDAGALLRKSLDELQKD